MSSARDGTSSQDQPQSFNQAQPTTHDESPPPDQQQLSPQAMTDGDDIAKESISLPGKPPGLYLRQFSPLLVPLSFAILVFLFTVPFELRRQMFLPLLPLSLLLIALVMIQGTLLYFAGSNNTYWTLWIVIGFALFVVVGTLAIFGFGVSLLLLLLLLAICALLANRSILQVPKGHADIVLVYGKYARTLYPGLNILLPWEKIARRVNTEATPWTSRLQRIRVSPDYDVELSATIRYQLMPEDAHLAFWVNDWEERLKILFKYVIDHDIAKLYRDGVIKITQMIHHAPTIQANWEQIDTLLYQAMQDRASPLGVQIIEVLIRDVQLVPHTSDIPEIPLPEIPQKDKVSILAQLRETPSDRVDLLHFRPFANSIAKDLIPNSIKGSYMNTSLTIAVYGGWGCGKTSFLQMVSKRLEANDIGIHPIWFNAWKYVEKDNLWAALIQRILDQAPVYGKWYRRAWVKFRIWKDTIRLSEGLWEIIRKIFPVILKCFFIFIGLYLLVGLDNKTIASFLHQWFPNIPVSVQESILKVIGVLTAAVAALSGPFSLIDLFKGNLGIDYSKFKKKPNYREHIAFLDEFHKELENITRLLGRGKKPLVIIIDDLDRCPYDQVIQVIEAIKIFLDTEGCVFLLGIDRDLVVRAIANKYKDIMGIDGSDSDILPPKKPVFYEEYIDKIIHLAFVLPRLTQSNTTNFISLVCEDEDIKRCASIFGTGLSPNPRKIKRILRTFLFVRDMAANVIPLSSGETTILAKLIVIQNEMPLIFDAIRETPDILYNLEGYYKERAHPPAPSRADIIFNTPRESYYKPFQEQAEKFETMYPQFPQLLLAPDSFSNTDSFFQIERDRYMYLLKLLGVVVWDTDQMTLMDYYNAIRDGRITDPRTIRKIAERLNTIAQDPETRSDVFFDAARAAEYLSLRAKEIEEEVSKPDVQ
jgi:hypothetical protein